MKRQRRWLAACALLGVCALLAPGTYTTEAAAETIWEQAAGTTKKASTYEAAMAIADEYVISSAHHWRSGQGRRARDLGRRAVEQYEVAAKADPKAEEPHYRAAEVLYSFFVDQARGVVNRTEAKGAIDHWVEFQRLAPRDPRLDSVLFRRSITRTKLGGKENYRLALEDYEVELGIIDEASSVANSVATILSNAAELHMSLGDLDDAISRYRQSLRYEDNALYAYGLAVALDRDGQQVKAREIMASYAQSDQMRQLTRRGVFFIPEGEINYYMALGHESLGDNKKAIKSYSAFLRKLPDSQFAERARENLAAVKKMPSKKVTPKPRPRDKWWRP